MSGASEFKVDSSGSRLQSQTAELNAIAGEIGRRKDAGILVRYLLLTSAAFTTALLPASASAQQCDYNCSDYSSGGGGANFSYYDPYANYSTPSTGNIPPPPDPDPSPTPAFDTTRPASFWSGPSPNSSEMATVRSSLTYTAGDAARAVSQSANPGDSSDPVRDGELFIQATDVSLPGPIPFEFRRTYRSRSRHLGVLGFGWDHSYNRRVIAANQCGDVDLLTGDGSRIRFTVGKVTTDTTFYNTPAGVPLSLRKQVSNGTTTWSLFDGNALRYDFDSAGLLAKVSDKESHSISVYWDVLDRRTGPKESPTLWPVPLGEDLIQRVQRVQDSTGRAIYFNYEHANGQVAWFLTCLSLDTTCSSPLVSFAFSSGPGRSVFGFESPQSGNLITVKNGRGQATQYSYYDCDKDSRGNCIEKSDFLGDDDADAYCANACGTSSDCHTASVCGRVTADCKLFLSNFKNSDQAGVCVDSFLVAQGCSRPPVGHQTPQQFDAACPYVRDTTVSGGCAQSCYQSLLKNETYGGCFDVVSPGYYLPGFACPSIYPGAAGSDVVRASDIHAEWASAYCSQLCYAQARCGGTVDNMCAVINDASIPFCNLDNGGTCESNCRGRYHYKNSSGQPQYAFGAPADLYHNLIDIKDDNGTLIQHNVYGTVVTDPSFDKVVSQQLGDQAKDTLVFHYVDYPHNAFSLDGSGDFLVLFDVLPQLPDMVSSLGTAVAASLDGSNTQTLSALTLFPWARFVDSLDVFRSVSICPATCVKSKPTIQLPPVPYIPPPIVQLPPIVVGSTPVAVLPVEGNNIVHLLVPAPGTPTTGTVSLGGMVPLISDGLVANLNGTGAALSLDSAQTAAVTARTVTLRPIQKPGDYKLQGDESQIKVLTKQVVNPQVLMLTAGQLTLPSTIFNPPPAPPDLSTRSACDRWAYSDPWVGSTTPADPQIPTHAVVVQDLHSVVRTQYYDAAGRVLREVNNHTSDGKPREVTDYNYDPISGALQAIRYPGGRRSCQETDWLARPTQSTTLPASGAPGNALADITVYEYGTYAYSWGASGATLPPLSDIIRDPDSSSPAIIHFERDSWQRILEQRVQVDVSRRASTFYSYDPAPTFGPKTKTSASGGVTTFDGYTPSGPGLITLGSNGIDPVTTRIVYDAYGRPGEVRRLNHLLGSHRVADARGVPLLEGTTSPINGQWVDVNYSDYDVNDRPHTVDGSTSVVALGYTALGYLRWQVETPKPLRGVPSLPRRATCFNYAADGRLESVLEPEGNIRNFYYDDASRLVRVEEGYPAALPDWVNGCVQDLRNNVLPTPNLTPPQDLLGLEVTETIDYDGSGFPARVADGSGLGRTLVNDGLGRTIDVVDDRDDHVRRGYDARGRVIWEAALGANPPAYAKPTGLAAGVPLQAMVEYQYDNLNRTTQVSRWHFAGGQWVNPNNPTTVTTVAYDDAHATVSSSVDGRSPAVTKVDGAGRTLAVTLPTGSTSTWAWQENGSAGDRITKTVTGPDGSPRTFYDYLDDAGRLTQREDVAHVALLQQDYDAYGRVFRRIVGNHLSTRDYDAYRRLSAQTEVGSFGQLQNTFTWDGNDRLISARDPSGNETSYGYDGVGRKARAAHPGGLASVWHYYAGTERVHDNTDPWGIAHTYGYDASGNLTSDHAAVASTAFALPSQDRSFTYSALNQLATAALSGDSSNPTNGTVVSIGYDSLGNRVSETSSHSPVSISQTWSPVGGATSTQLRFTGAPSTPLIQRTFDDIGRLLTANINQRPVVVRGYESKAGKTTYGSGAIAEQPTFDVRGRQTATDISLNGLSLASQTDVLGLDGVVRERERVFARSQPLIDVYRLDDAGRLDVEVRTQQFDSLPLPGPDVTDDQVTQWFGQLAGICTEGITCPRPTSFAVYTLDSDSNWLSMADPTGTHTASFTSLSGSNQYSTFGRDSNGTDGAEWQYTGGHATQVGADSYTYNVFGQLTSATTASGSVIFGYDALGRRIYEQDVATGAVTDTVWDDASVLAMGSPSDANSYSIRVGGNGIDEHLGIAQGFGAGALLYLHQASDGSVLAATDESGLREGYAYSGYGTATFFDGSGATIPQSSIGNRFLFQGQLYDPTVRGYAMRAREYRPDVGRFLSPDPIGVAGGENLYAFVLGKPLAFADPFGLSAQTAIRSSFDRAAFQKQYESLGAAGRSTLLAGVLSEAASRGLIQLPWYDRAILSTKFQFGKLPTMLESMVLSVPANFERSAQLQAAMGNGYNPLRDPYLRNALGTVTAVGGGVLGGLSKLSSGGVVGASALGEATAGGRLVALDTDAVIKFSEISDALQPGDRLVVTPNVVSELERFGIKDVGAFLDARGIGVAEGVPGASVPASALHSQLDALVGESVGNAGDALNISEAGGIGADLFITCDKNTIGATFGSSGSVYLPYSGGTSVPILVK